MNLDLQKLRNFKETFTLLKEIDVCVKGGDMFVLFFENRIELVDSITFMNMDGVKYFAALACKIWSNMGYTNRSMKLIGMFDEGLNLTRKIPLPNGINLVNIKFKRYRNSYYNEYKPIFEVEGPDMEKKVVEVPDEEAKYGSDNYIRLYELATDL